MANKNLAFLFYFYGIYMIVCGILPFFFVGPSARSAFVSGIFSAGLAFTCGYFLNQGRQWAFWLGNLLALFLLGIFAWRASVSFLRLVDLIAYGDSFQLPEKALSFLILLSMFLMSLIVLSFAVFTARNILIPPPSPTLQEAPPEANPVKL
jgi:uncharacterized membrane protein (UPF0136 family)